MAVSDVVLFTPHETLMPAPQRTNMLLLLSMRRMVSSRLEGCERRRRLVSLSVPSPAGLAVTSCDLVSSNLARFLGMAEQGQ